MSTKSLLAAGSIIVIAAALYSQTPRPSSLRVYVLDGGSLNIPDTAPYRLKKEDIATNSMSVVSFLIVHPRGTMIWDTGAVPDSAFPAGGGPGTLRYASSTKPLKPQPAAAGFQPSDINFLALSHFHWDHVGNANLFAGATWLVPQSERDIMFTDPPSPRTEPQNFSALRNSKTVILSQSTYDVFGDGSVVIMSAPGHSPGHQVLFLKLTKTGPIVLSGDLYHYPEERKPNLVPLTEYNPERTLASRAMVEAFLKKNGAQLWIQHDFNAMRALRKAPEFYE